MPTDTKVNFDVNIRRAGYFLDLHESVHGGAQGAPQNPVRELPRAAVVFAIGALDAYLSDVSAEVLVTMLQNAVPGPEVREILKRVHGNVPTLSLELVLIANQAEREARLQEAIADHLHNHVSNHGAKAVSRTMALLNGSANDMWHDMRNNGFPDVTGELDEWTTKRHQIVHQGQTVRVQRWQARQCIDLVDEVGRRIDEQAITCIAGQA